MSANLELLVPQNGSLEEVLLSKPTACFSQDRKNFLSELANSIIKTEDSRKYPDLLAFAFWCSNSNVSKLEARWDFEFRTGRGVIFHIAPSNVPINFAYSWAAGFITGNVNVVRIPSKHFDQVELLITILNKLICRDEFLDLSKDFALVRYPRDKSINDYLSSKCDVRVIWGGDQTISEIRQSSIPAKTYDVTFADRYSMSIIDSQEYIDLKEKQKLAKAFFNDTYLMDQNACTSPHLIIWIGEESVSRDAQRIFWNALENLVTKEYEISTISVINKLVTSYKYASTDAASTVSFEMENKLVRIEISELKQGIDDFKSDSGLFYEFLAQDIKQISPAINNKFQTLSYFGINPLLALDLVKEMGISGIDRIVPIGKTLDFDLIWDGYELPAFYTRAISVIQTS
jgi:hypothetical protein